MPLHEQLKLVVLTSSPIGIEVAARLVPLPAVRSVTVVTAPLGRGRTPLVTKLRNIYRLHGPRGVFAAAFTRLRYPRPRVALAEMVRKRCPAVKHLHVQDFHDPMSLDYLRALEPDLGIVAATYVLRATVFTIPRLGCLNLHLGRAPEFRGSSPAFYEMLYGVNEVGITIHRVTDALDGGNILLQQALPLELAPSGDPVAYLDRYQEDVLVPNGARLMAEAVTRIADGTAEEWPQDHSQARTYQRATYALKRKLRRLVAERQRISTLN